MGRKSVSIRAPALRPGRPPPISYGEHHPEFQSAPRPCDRGDRRRGRRCPQFRLFQSAPRPCDRGDPGERRRRWSGRCFNPRPGLATGATRCRSKWTGLLVVSIRAPALRPGRRSNAVEDSPAQIVSIRAPALRPGRQHRLSSGDALDEFQSAPRPCDRGDGKWCWLKSNLDCFNPRPGLATGATP